VATPTINFGGLASGLDTNTLIQQLMAIERQPQVKLTQKQKIEEARQKALRDVDAKLEALLSAAKALRDVGTWLEKQTVTSSNEALVGVTTNGTPPIGGHTIYVQQLARAHQVRSDTFAAAPGIQDKLTIQLGGEDPITIDVAATDTLQQIADKINSASGTGVYASVVSDRLVLSGRKTGADYAITVTDGDPGNGVDLAAALGFTTTVAPQDAEFWVNTPAASRDASNMLTSSSNVITDALPGLTLTLKGITSEDVAIGVTSAVDNADIVAKVEDFVTKYNEAVDLITEKLRERKVANATTDADRAKGVLAGDVGLTILLSRLRGAIADTVSGQPSGFESLAELGITTGETTGSSDLNQDAVRGKLVFDTTVFEEKLAASFANVQNLLRANGGTYDTNGVGYRFQELIEPFTKSDGTIAATIESSARTVESLKDRYAALEVRLAAREAALRRQFTAMEQALQNAQQQGAWLTGQLARLL
jgi:flagellar hook-associated protein 2